MDKTSLKAHLSQALIAEQPKTLGTIKDVLLSTLFEIVGQITPDMKAAARDAALEVYDEACKVIDLPKVPEFIEVRIEAAGRKALETWINVALGL